MAAWVSAADPSLRYTPDPRLVNAIRSEPPLRKETRMATLTSHRQSALRTRQNRAINLFCDPAYPIPGILFRRIPADSRPLPSQIRI